MKIIKRGIPNPVIIPTLETKCLICGTVFQFYATERREVKTLKCAVDCPVCSQPVLEDGFYIPKVSYQ